jgi:tetratricopeptide (TPR) repeat protein
VKFLPVSACIGGSLARLRRLLTSFPALPVFWVFLSTILSGCNSDARQLQQRAEVRLREGNYEEAVQLNRLLYLKDPQAKTAAQALLTIGDIYYLQMRRIKDAVEAYKKLVDEFAGRPEEYKARLQLATIFENEMADLTQAVAEYDLILQSPELDNRFDIEFRRANAYFKMEDYNRALRDLRRLEEAGVSGHLAHQVYLKIGSIYQIQRRFEEAESYFQRVKESPCLECRRRAIMSLAETYEAVYDVTHAIETIQKLDHTPENDRIVTREVARLKEKERRLGTENTQPWRAKE